MNVGFTLPLERPSKIVCVGRNYVAHAREMGNSLPREPLLFLKPPSSLLAPGAPIVLPRVSHQVEHEGEIAVQVGKRLRLASEEEEAQAPQRLRRRDHELVEESGGDEGEGHRCGPDAGGEKVRIEHLVPVEDFDAGAVQQRAPDLKGRGIEGQRRKLQKDVVGVQRDVIGALDQPQHRAMLNQHPFRAPCRAGCVHDVRQTAAAYRHIGNGGNACMGKHIVKHSVKHIIKYDDRGLGLRQVRL